MVGGDHLMLAINLCFAARAISVVLGYSILFFILEKKKMNKLACTSELTIGQHCSLLH